MNEKKNIAIDVLQASLAEAKAKVAEYLDRVDALAKAIEVLSEKEDDSKLDVAPVAVAAPVSIPVPVEPEVVPETEVPSVTNDPESVTKIVAKIGRPAKAKSAPVVVAKTDKPAVAVSRPPMKLALVEVIGSGVMTAQQALAAMTAKGWLIPTKTPTGQVSMTLSQSKELFECVERGKFRVLVAPTTHRKAAPVAKPSADATFKALGADPATDPCPMPDSA